nr:plastid terminal oxidase (PTOX) [Polytomella parva]|eukprot:CAMPEP_0175049292 /NCGR_PEP_ID=MMETSP0052_2-20121109/6655_1 /TAXON_ID=51329 ORGANISM="Polytomella parva, Strain SAG 63-3" /NCGR_SAMPLE_ID=MMETSP0052_2 /ASSEMBLY_ACC=CAM_ASM_000194 /LENGTH=356 /DNA_ID=CAMNT_0016313433 /DNA_START=266 /DNA_END=1336 /DNA_ORIENTATION=-
MTADFGFRTGTRRLYQDHYGEIPNSLSALMKENLSHEMEEFRRSLRFKHYKPVVGDAPTGIAKIGKATNDGLSRLMGALDRFLEEKNIIPKLTPPPQMSTFDSPEFQKELEHIESLTLTSHQVEEVEHARIARYGDMDSPLWVKVPFFALCWLLDALYENRPIQKFWVLETVARIPYFAYISILHLYESLGLWRAGAELRKVHFAEEWNEMHHLQIMESLGGDQHWFDRFFGQWAAVGYYWLIIAFYMFSPKIAYNFMQRVELHAYDTYAAFVEVNRDLLKQIPPPMVALSYYRTKDLYLFDEFQQNPSETVQKRRPECSDLYDTFVNIRDDEFEHVRTMIACQDDTVAKTLAIKS